MLLNKWNVRTHLAYLLPAIAILTSVVAVAPADDTPPKTNGPDEAQLKKLDAEWKVLGRTLFENLANQDFTAAVRSTERIEVVLKKIKAVPDNYYDFHRHESFLCEVKNCEKYDASAKQLIAAAAKTLLSDYEPENRCPSGEATKQLLARYRDLRKKLGDDNAVVFKFRGFLVERCRQLQLHDLRMQLTNEEIAMYDSHGETDSIDCMRARARQAHLEILLNRTEDGERHLRELLVILRKRDTDGDTLRWCRLLLAKVNVLRNCGEEATATLGAAMQTPAKAPPDFFDSGTAGIFYAQANIQLGQYSRAAATLTPIIAAMREYKRQADVDFAEACEQMSYALRYLERDDEAKKFADEATKVKSLIAKEAAIVAGESSAATATTKK